MSADENRKYWYRRYISFSYNDSREKTPSHLGKKPFFTDHVYNGQCNEPKMVGWCQLFADKKSESYN